MKDNTIKLITPKYNKEDLDELLVTYDDLNNIVLDLTQELDKIKNYIEREMKTRKWTQYQEQKRKITVNINTIQKESVNKNALKILLTDDQYGQVITKKSKQNLLIVTPRERTRLIKYVKKQ